MQYAKIKDNNEKKGLKGKKRKKKECRESRQIIHL